MKPITVLSLFDGISCGQVALQRAGIAYDNYYASEIDKYAIQITQKNFPNTIQLGDVKQIWARNLPKIDLLIGGSPCQDLSIAKNNRQGLNGARSGLFWHYVRLLRTCKPKYFLLENVASMPKEAKDIISRETGVEPILINSALVSAQQRKRLYWTNIPNITQPSDKGIMLKDILKRGIAYQDKNLCIKSQYYKSGTANFLRSDGFKATGVAEPICVNSRSGRGNNPNAQPSIQDRIFATNGKMCSLHTFGVCNVAVPMVPERIGEIGGNKAQANRIYSVRGKSVCLNANGGGSGAKTGLYKIDLPDGDYIIRKLTPVECERLQTLTSVKNKYIIHICLDNQKNYVSVENQNPKSLSVVGSVENDRKKESVSCAEQYSNANNLLLNNVALPNVQVSIGENQLAIRYQNTVLLNASFAEILNKFPHLKAIENFARTFVLINTIVAQTTNNGKAESQQKETNLIQVQNGSTVVELCGKEIKPLVEYADKNMPTVQKLLNATTLYPLSIKNTEQTLQTLFYYVANVICSFIPKEIQRNCILNIQTDLGYTFGVSNTQRYKCLGNGWTVDVIAHIFSFIKEDVNGNI